MRQRSIPSRLVDPLSGDPVGDRMVDRLMPFARLLAKYHRYEIRGLNRIPRKGRVLVVVNHSLATYDAFLFGAAILKHVRRWPVGLADRHFFRFKLVADFVRRLGLVEGNPAYARSALRRGEMVCVAPGGMREALRPSRQRYQVLWKKRRGFAELALRTQTPVVLAACPAADDIYHVFPSFLTKWFYQKRKYPFVLFKGWGPTWIPRPAKLIHYVSRPLRPSIWKRGNRRFDILLDRFHQELSAKMLDLLSEPGSSERL